MSIVQIINNKISHFDVKMWIFHIACEILNTCCSIAVLWSIYDDKIKPRIYLEHDKKIE